MNQPDDVRRRWRKGRIIIVLFVAAIVVVHALLWSLAESLRSGETWLSVFFASARVFGRQIKDFVVEQGPLMLIGGLIIVFIQYLSFHDTVRRAGQYTVAELDQVLASGKVLSKLGRIGIPVMAWSVIIGLSAVGVVAQRSVLEWLALIIYTSPLTLLFGSLFDSHNTAYYRWCRKYGVPLHWNWKADIGQDGHMMMYWIAKPRWPWRR